MALLPDTEPLPEHANRAPFQVLVIPWTIVERTPRYAVFRRSDDGNWQFVSGGGERGETPVQAAVREGVEEAGIPETAHYVQLKSVSMIPVLAISRYPLWGPDVFEIPEHSFAVEVDRETVTLSKEHTEFRWVNCDDACDLLKWDSNRAALTELNNSILHS